MRRVHHGRNPGAGNQREGNQEPPGQSGSGCQNPIPSARRLILKRPPAVKIPSARKASAMAAPQLKTMWSRRSMKRVPAFPLRHLTTRPINRDFQPAVFDREKPRCRDRIGHSFRFSRGSACVMPTFPSKLRLSIAFVCCGLISCSRAKPTAPPLPQPSPVRTGHEDGAPHPYSIAKSRDRRPHMEP